MGKVLIWRKSADFGAYFFQKMPIMSVLITCVLIMSVLIFEILHL